MSLLKTNSIQHNDASAANITLDGSKNVTCENNVTVDGTLTQTGAATFAGLNTFNNVSTFNKPARGPTTTLSSSSSEVAVDLSLRNNYTLALAENTTIKNPSGEVAGQSGSIFITQDGTGSRTAAWESHYLWAGGTAPTLTTTASAVDRIDYIVLDSDKVHCVASLDVK